MGVFSEQPEDVFIMGRDLNLGHTVGERRCW